MIKASGRHFAACKKGPRWIKIIAVLLAATLVSASTCAAYFYVKLSANVTVVDIGEKEAIDIDHDPIQILVLGTDTRTGEGNGAYGSELDSAGDGNSDVMMLLQLSGDRQNVSVISFPRDLMTAIPACPNPQTGKIEPEEPLAMLNSALAKGGPSCAVATVNKMTGIQVDHFMMADFNAVKELTKAINGVEVCVDRDINDAQSGLNIVKGRSNLEGEQALAFVRTRHGFGDGSDTGRIKAQQAFLASLTRKVISQDLLNDIPKLLVLADIMTKHLTIDKDLKSPQAMLKIAEQFRNVNAKGVTFITVPNEPWLKDVNRLQLKEPDARKVFKILQEDRKLEGLSDKSSSKKPSASPTAPPVPVQNNTPIKIVDSSGTNAIDTAFIVDALTSLGYINVTTAVTLTTTAQTKLLYNSAYAAGARDIAQKLNIPARRLAVSDNVEGMQVILGQDLSSGILGTPTELEGQNADEDICQQGANF